MEEKLAQLPRQRRHLGALDEIAGEGVGQQALRRLGADAARAQVEDGVVVELTHGYRECPDDLLDVLVHMAAQGQAAASAGAGIATSLTSGPFTMQVSAAAQAGAVGLSGQHRGVLNKYRLGPVP